MNGYRWIITTVFAYCLAFLFQACQDDLGIWADEGADGETTLSLDVAFSPFAESTLTRATTTMAPPGEGMNDIADLCLLVYGSDGKLLEGYPKKVDLLTLKTELEQRNPADASNGQTPAEEATKCVKNIRLRLPFGNYYIVAVANMGVYPTEKEQKEEGKIPQSTYEVLMDETGKYADSNGFKYQTLDGLRNMKVSWDPSNYCNNREMLGYFAAPDAQSPRYSSNFPMVAVNRSGMQLRAWLRRCVSKITIDFDGSGLRENVYVYIKDAKIYDIASECTLGFGKEGTDEKNATDYNNRVTKETELRNRPTGTYSGHHIDYHTYEGIDNSIDAEKGEEVSDADYTTWPVITKGTPRLQTKEGKVIDFHAQSQRALFFYENMQGEAPNGKIPVADIESGNVANSTQEKDGVPLGTYVEVTAHYHSDANGNIADGDIKYRFMIGKDVTKSCDAERNYHYKLTLRLRGNANDYDWHIGFDEPEGFDVPNPWYVSYLYNHDALLPFKYTPPAGYKVTRMVAEIVQNPWYPSKLTEKQLTDPTVLIEPTVPYGEDPQPYGEESNRDDGNGFLSLRETNKLIISDEDVGGWPGYGKDATPTINNYYYKGKNGGIDRSRREYYFDEVNYEKDPTRNGREAYSYQKDGDKITFNIPLFTRAKVMVKKTGYSGNNPFVGYQRVARVKLIATVKNEKGDSLIREEMVNVVQVRRVVNPKGVYRDEGKYEPFHVRMMWLDGDDKLSFTPATSHGPWMAEIIGDANFITLNGKQTISGATESNIDFTIQFNRMSTGNKNAVVRIKYHNYTCTHLIFVRQGYKAQEVVKSGKDFNNQNGGATPKKWGTFNMITCDSLATDPREEGSLFKFGAPAYPIDEKNNAYMLDGKEDYRPPVEAEFISQTPTDFIIAGTDKKITWKNIPSNADGFTSGKIGNAATMRDFEQLYLSDNMQFGYGVLYADGATETQSLVNMAYGYHRSDTSKEAKKKGMRGMFVYYWDRENPTDPYNGRNVFFPIGRSGYGHRKNGYEAKENVEKGILRYSSIRYQPASKYKEADGAVFSFYKDSPFFVSLYRNQGAIYWAKKTVPNQQYLGWDGVKSNEGVAYGLDINYFSFDVNAISAVSVGSGNDACFVRCVE